MAKHKEKPVFSILIILGSLILAMILSNVPTLLTLESELLDYRFRLRGPLDLSESPIVILAIDDQSDIATPEIWPWPRQYFAHVVENLNEAGVKAIGIDIIFEQADYDSGGTESDRAFADALADYDNVILSGKLFVPQGRAGLISLVEPYELFLESGTDYGLVSFDLDADGFYRRYLVGQTYNDTVYASFAAAVLKKYADMPDSVEVTEDEEAFYLGSYRIPKYNSYSSIINYSGPSGTFQKYSFADVLDDFDFDLVDEFDLDSFDDPGDEELGLPPGLLYSGQLKDKIVLIGSMVQEHHDDFPTPYLEKRDEEDRLVQVLTYGVEIHANMLQMILAENYLVRVSYQWTILIALVLAILVFIFTRYLPTLWGTIVSLGTAVLYFVVAFYLFGEMNLILEMIFPILTVLIGYGGQTLYQYVLSQREKKVIRGAFSHYVPEKVVSEILEDPDKLKLGGEERVVTVMFSDVAGFTSISEKLTPAQLVHLLNEYLTEMTDTVLEYEGIIDKYEGDAIMAEFGVPVHYDDHAQKACYAALEMQSKLRIMREKWKREDKPQLTARIGINTGEVIVGNMGSRDVFDYTVMGDHVNLGSRLEGANKFYGTYIMISEFTYELVKNDFYTRELDLIRVKGKDQPIRVHELIARKDEDLDENHHKLLKLYAEGLKHYRAQSWNEAIDCFEACLNIDPDDTPSSEYRGRCIEYKFNSPGPEWDGVHVMKEK